MITEQTKQHIQSAIDNLVDEIDRAPHRAIQNSQAAMSMIMLLDYYEPKTCKCKSAPKAKKKSPTQLDAD